MFLIELALKLQNFVEQILMLLFVNRESRVTGHPHQALFEQKMGVVYSARRSRISRDATLPIL